MKTILLVSIFTIGLLLLIKKVSLKCNVPIADGLRFKESILFFLNLTVTVSKKVALETIKFKESTSIGVCQ